MNGNCLVCSGPECSSFSNFCYAHQAGWVSSPERREIEWTSDESYNSQCQKYVDRIKNEEAEVSSGDSVPGSEVESEVCGIEAVSAIEEENGEGQVVRDNVY